MLTDTLNRVILYYIVGYLGIQALLFFVFFGLKGTYMCPFDFWFFGGNLYMGCAATKPDKVKP